MKRRGQLNKHFCKKNPNIPNETEKIVKFLFQGGERTSQSRDQNIEKGYTLRNFLSLRTGKIDFLLLPLFHYVKLHLLSVKPTSSWLSLHIKLFDILQVLQTFHYKGKIKRDTFTLL